MDDERWKFLQEVFLSNSIRDSLTTRKGARVYIENPTDQQRTQLGRTLRSELIRLGATYIEKVSEEEHISNIQNLVLQVSLRCGPFLNGGCIHFGIAQKALNSYLKYLWCDGKIETPPHCPFDAIIIGKLNLPAHCSSRWTNADESAYRAWIIAAKSAAEPEPLSNWELRVWSE